MSRNTTLTASASQHAVALMNEIKRQGQPRRWPWEPKTIRDLLAEGRADLAEAALARSNELASAAAQQRDTIVGEIQRQAKPRRWPWQEKTAYDQVIEQRTRVANAAIERATKLSEAATSQRDRLVLEARRQSQPRRWPWQEPTLRDKLEARGDTIRTTLAETIPTVRQSADVTAERVRRGAQQTATVVQQRAAATPQLLSQAAANATDTVKDTTLQVAQRVGATAESAAGTVKAAALAPVEAVREGVEASQQAVSQSVAAGRRRVRRGVRFVQVVLWALLIGAAIGILLAPRSGNETRRNLQELWDRVVDLVAPTA